MSEDRGVAEWQRNSVTKNRCSFSLRSALEGDCSFEKELTFLAVFICFLSFLSPLRVFLLISRRCCKALMSTA